MTLEKIYLDYTQQELDDAYDQPLWAPNFRQLLDASKVRCGALRRRMKNHLVHYGDGEEQAIEILPASTDDAPVLVFVHGGRWKPASGDPYIWFADTVVDLGVHFVAAKFSTLDPPTRSTRLPDMVDDLYKAFAWLYANVKGFGGNPERIHVIGHSSGAHLTGVLLTTDWTALGLPADILKSATCVSGIYDMHPVLLSARSSYVELSSEEEDRLSAIRHADRIACPVVVAYGSLESPEFKRHGRTFAAALREAGVLREETVLEGKNHFEGIRTMMDPETPLARVVFSMVAEAP